VGAGEGKIRVNRLAAMLLSDDVINGEGEFGDVRGDSAIFTAVAGSYSDAYVQRFLLRTLLGQGLADFPMVAVRIDNAS
jgi:hypothetical protein